MTLHNLTDIILGHFLIKKPACVTFFSKRQTTDMFFVLASYDRLSVTVIIDGNFKDTKGRNASLGKGGEGKDRRKKERKKR